MNKEIKKHLSHINNLDIKINNKIYKKIIELLRNNKYLVFQNSLILFN